MKITLTLLLLSLMLAAPAVRALAPGAAPLPLADKVVAADPREEMDRAFQRVSEIVNQPITHLPYTEWSIAMVFKGEWFVTGGAQPDYGTADVRATQQLPYEAYDHVTSNLNPGEMFNGKDLEFNPTLQYLYKDNTLPKKRLTEAEMLEINSLFRVIAHDKKRLAEIERERLARLPSIKELVTVYFYPTDRFGHVMELLVLTAAALFAYKKIFRT